MKSKVKYTNEPMGKLGVADDFLPVPENLVFKEDNIKVTKPQEKGRDGKRGDGRIKL